MRISLHLKLAITHLAVAALVLLSTLVYVRTLLNRELQESVQQDLERNLLVISANLADASPDRLDDIVAIVRTVVPHRVAVFDTAGQPFGSTTVKPLTDAPGLPPQRAIPASSSPTVTSPSPSTSVAVIEPPPLSPELREALAEGTGRTVRPDEAGESTIFAAARFPLEGPTRGLVRLAIPASVVSAESGRFPFLNRAGAAALSFAIFLSLGAAWMASRPLRKIAAAARAFAAGDFGHPVGFDSRDELGEAARALEELAAQLRNRLLASGADRAALHTLLNELPVGVILYDGHGSPLAVNGRARTQCGFTPGDELDRAQQLLELASQAPLVQRVVETGAAAESELSLPWNPHTTLTARWIALYAADGSRQPALVLLDGETTGTANADRTPERQQLTPLLRDAAQQPGVDPEIAARLALTATRIDAQARLPPLDDVRVSTIESTEMLREALWRIGPVARGAEVMVELPFDAPAVKLADCDDRLPRATAWFLAEVVNASPGGGRLRLRLRRTERSLQVVARTVGGRPRMEPAARLLQPLGGDASAVREGDVTESRLELPLA